MIETVLIQLAILIGVGLILSGLATLLKQPLTIGYIATGIFLGPSVLNIIQTNDFLGTFAQFGIVVLLFTVGLNLSPKVFRQVGKASFVTGLGQILTTTLIGFTISHFLGYSITSSIYIAIALTFSSTIIVMKFLSDSIQGDNLFGRMSVGILLFQDVAVMIILAIISSISKSTNNESLSLQNISVIICILLLLVPISIYVLPKILKKIAKSQEYLLLFSLGWCLLLAVSFRKLNFSMEIGALLAGITLSMSSYRHEIVSRVKPLRDFFIFLFFVTLGSQMRLANFSENIMQIIVFSLFVLVGKTVIVYLIMNILGYSKKCSLLTGLALSQISEFSLILLALGVGLKQISPDVLSIVTIVTLISISGSAYTMAYGEKIYSILSKYLPNLSKKHDAKIGSHNKPDNNDIVVFGYDKIGFSLMSLFKRLGKKYLIIDFNPEIIKYLKSIRANCMYGDADDTVFLDELKLPKKKMVVSTIPVYETNSLIIKKVREYSEKTIVILVSNSIADSLKLYDEGANYVIIPRFLGGEHASNIIEKNEYDLEKFAKDRLAHIDNLGDRDSIKHFL